MSVTILVQFPLSSGYAAESRYMGRDEYTDDVRFPPELSRPNIPRVRLSDLRSTLGESSRCVPEAAIYDRLVALHNR
jgi:hypothetical protein